jgi:secondary thiamine-phosphate synthase enzyme
MWASQTIRLRPRDNGFHLVTTEITEAVPEIQACSIGLLHLLLQHTSASLTLNENADPDVRGDLQRHFEQLAPRDAPYYRHSLEGPDDMPAHIKSVLIGCELTVPIRNGRLALGTWQGIYLCEHRDQAGSRTVLATLQGLMRP